MKEREKAFENKFFHDKETLFKLQSRQKKLLGLWAAGVMHKSEEESLEYALELVTHGVSDSNDGAVVSKVYADIDTAGLDFTESDIREKMEELKLVAMEQLEEEA